MQEKMVCSAPFCFWVLWPTLFFRWCKAGGPTAVLLVETAQSPKRQLIILASEQLGLDVWHVWSSVMHVMPWLALIGLDLSMIQHASICCILWISLNIASWSTVFWSTGQGWFCRSCPDFTLALRSGRLLAPPILLPLNCPKIKLAENLGERVLRPHDKAVDVAQTNCMIYRCCRDM